MIMSWFVMYCDMIIYWLYDNDNDTGVVRIMWIMYWLYDHGYIIREAYWLYDNDIVVVCWGRGYNISSGKCTVRPIG